MRTRIAGRRGAEDFFFGAMVATMEASLEASVRAGAKANERASIDA